MLKKQVHRYWSVSSLELCNAAKEMGMKVEIISKEKNTFYISDSNKEILFKSTDFWENSSLWNKISEDKWLTYSILERNNFPTAKSRYISKSSYSSITNRDLWEMRMPFIIKPLGESHWDWVMMCINTLKELNKKLSHSLDFYDEMIIQEQVAGDEVRVVIVKWEVIIAINRIPASVIGDGKLSISELITQENSKNPLRGPSYESPLLHIKIDSELKSYISKQWFSLEDIWKNKERIQLRGNSNIGTWWTMKDVSKIIHPSTKKMCIEVTKLFWFWICWVDIIARDISKPLSEQWWVILEINDSPWLGGDRELTGINTAQEILKRVFTP